ncbi:MAG: Thiosulfate sulfurtransferase GlpE [Verrucomicrobiae bacterium]|nr:Thiosulfate sulfurtransferase GlpE [Verrucomicrobiae bacterium]
MKNSLWLIIAVILVVVVFVRARAGGLAPEVAQQHLKNGALLVDVRSAGEFNSQHVPGAINFSYDKIGSLLPAKESDKSKTILLYCRSGRRSGIAEKRLRELGYTNVFNLGSYSQAEKTLTLTK